MRTTSILVIAVLAVSGQAAVISPRENTLVARDACGNGIKIRGSGSVSCSNGQCTACSNGKCCTVKSPSNNSCNSATPYLNLDTCQFEGSSTSGGSGTSTGGTSSGGTTTQPTQPARYRTFGDYLRSLFGGR